MKRKPRAKGHILLPEQVARQVYPLHVSLELLPLGLFQRGHADHLAKIINLITVDSAGRRDGMYDLTVEAGEVLQAMFERVREGKRWNVTADERATLTRCIREFDRYLRRWTTTRFDVAAATVNEINNQAKAAGGQFLDKVSY